MNSQSWFLLELTGLITLHTKRFSRVFSSTTIEGFYSILVFVYLSKKHVLSTHFKPDIIPEAGSTQVSKADSIPAFLELICQMMTNAMEKIKPSKGKRKWDLKKFQQEGYSDDVAFEKMETVKDFIFLGSKIIVDSDCSHEIKTCLLLGRKAMTNLDIILKTETLFCQQKSL